MIPQDVASSDLKRNCKFIWTFVGLHFGFKILLGRDVRNSWVGFQYRVKRLGYQRTLSQDILKANEFHSSACQLVSPSGALKEGYFGLAWATDGDTSWY